MRKGANRSNWIREDEKKIRSKGTEGCHVRKRSKTFEEGELLCNYKKREQAYAQRIDEHYEKSSKILKR